MYRSCMCEKCDADTYMQTQNTQMNGSRELILVPTMQKGNLTPYWMEKFEALGSVGVNNTHDLYQKGLLGVPI